MKENDADIQLEAYTMPKALMLRVVAQRHARPVLLTTAAAVVALAVCGVCIDLRFAVGALLLVFIVFPMLLMWLYVRYCLTRDVAMNVVEHTVRLSNDIFEVHWRPGLLSSELDEAAEGGEDGGVKPLPWRTDLIPISRVTRIDIGLKALTLWLADEGAGPGFLYLPYSTIPEGQADILIKRVKVSA